MKKLLTLVIVHQPPRLLLGMKKRGFGVGRWNGFGGKVADGETIEAAARRELREEAEIEAEGLEKLGVLEFVFQGNPQILETHIFTAEAFSGIPTETEEMRPQWFSIDDIPFGQMWSDDKHWLPLFLEGKKFKGKFLFGEGDAVMSYEINEVEVL